MNPQDIILCWRPCKLTVGDVRKLLLQKGAAARERLSDLILHRLQGRYVTPLDHVQTEPIDFRSGFLTMAAACLMIETFQCFLDGQKDTQRQGKATFEKFFSIYSAKFSGINGGEFYEKIRCGILHQAQTQGRFRIHRSGPLFDASEKSINAIEFLTTLNSIVEDYIANLRVEEMDEGDWPNALQKIEYICEAIENE